MGMEVKDQREAKVLKEQWGRVCLYVSLLGLLTSDCMQATSNQFPVALHQFLSRVEAEHFTCHVIYVDAHSVNLSAEAEEVAALFKRVILPVSAGTPQEMAHAESMVRAIKRRSTAMKAGAPHLGKQRWALCDKCAVHVQDFLPVSTSTRNFHCPFYLRTGRVIGSLENLGYSCDGGSLHLRSCGWANAQKG
jgi:hypothetical protein